VSCQYSFWHNTEFRRSVSDRLEGLVGRFFPVFSGRQAGYHLVLKKNIWTRPFLDIWSLLSPVLVKVTRENKDADDAAHPFFLVLRPDPALPGPLVYSSSRFQ